MNFLGFSVHQTRLTLVHHSEDSCTGLTSVGSRSQSQVEYFPILVSALCVVHMGDVIVRVQTYRLILSAVC